MFKTRTVLPGTAPGLLSAHARPDAVKPVIRVVEYDGNGITEREVATVAELPRCEDGGKNVWVEVNGTGDIEVIRQLGEKYGLHALALEDALHTPQRPKLERYEDHLFLIVQMLYRDAHDRLAGEQVSMFLGERFLITIQEESSFDVFDPVRKRLRAGTGFICKQGADYLAYALIDAVIDHCFPLLELIGDALEELENTVLKTPEARSVAQIHHFRRTLMQLRRFVWPERELINALLREEGGLVRAETKIFLRDCYDHTVQIIDLVENCREVASGLMELYLSAVGMRTNEIMRVLTVMSAIFIPLTFVAGVYGMNFDDASGAMPLNMPELHQPHGYIVCILVMLSISIGQIIFFKRKKWL